MKYIFAILLSMLFVNLANACRCLALEPIEEIVGKAKNIARVVPIEIKIVNFVENNEESIAAEGKVKLLEIYKGNGQSVLTFKDSSFASNCGMKPQVGREYIVIWDTEINLSGCWGSGWYELDRYNWPRFKGNKPPLVNRISNEQIVEKINAKQASNKSLKDAP